MRWGIRVLACWGALSACGRASAPEQPSVASEPAPPAGTAEVAPKVIDEALDFQLGAVCIGVNMPPLPPGSTPAEEADHRRIRDETLETIGFDGSCDEATWVATLEKYPDREHIYCALELLADQCERPEDAHAWAVRRVEAFPDSPDARFSLVMRTFGPLWPRSGLPHNEQLSPAKRVRVASDVLRLVMPLIDADPTDRKLRVYASMAYSQREWARQVVQEPKTPAERRELLRARTDAMSAWEQQKFVCDLDKLPSCAPGVTRDAPCCPPPPLSKAQHAADMAELARLEAELGAGGP